ncbi:hypothetical protein D3C76_673120 [compost metagenome]
MAYDMRNCSVDEQTLAWLRSNSPWLLQASIRSFLCLSLRCSAQSHTLLQVLGSISARYAPVVESCSAQCHYQHVPATRKYTDPPKIIAAQVREQRHGWEVDDEPQRCAEILGEALPPFFALVVKEDRQRTDHQEDYVTGHGSIGSPRRVGSFARS